MKGRSQRTRQKRRQTGSSQAGQAEEDRDRYGRMRGKKQNRRSTLRDTSAQRQPAGCGGVTGGRGCNEQGRRGRVWGGWCCEQQKVQINA